MKTGNMTTEINNAYDLTAAYSVEDNKLRLYASSHLSDELFSRVKEAGFKWAPQQELFVAPSWTPAREDFCIELAGEITPEETTLLERAEDKAARLDALSEKRIKQSNAFADAADQLSQRFAGGQPILVGHHSQRKAEKDAEKIDAQLRKSVDAMEASKYWDYRATGVERHANAKNNAQTRFNRIKTLLADLRGRQRLLNHSMKMIKLWEKVEVMKDQEERRAYVEKYCGIFTQEGSYAFYGAWDLLKDEKATPDEIISRSIAAHKTRLDNPVQYRWINHLLGRLGYERSELGEVVRFKGELTPVILQTFARTHGADKPKASKINDLWTVSSIVALPLHIANGSNELTLSAESWLDLMQTSGYEVPADKPKKPAILNFKCASIRGNAWGGVTDFKQIELTKAEYSAVYSDYRGVKVSECGNFRFKIYKDPNNKSLGAAWFAVYLTDSKLHSIPESNAIVLDNVKALA